MLTTTEQANLPFVSEQISAKNGAEAQAFVYDGAGEVRQKLVGAPEWMRGEYILPENTVVVTLLADELNSNTATNVSQQVGEVLNDDMFSQFGPNSNFRKLGPFTSLSMVGSSLYTPFEKRPALGEPDKSIVFIYDGQLPPKDEVVVLPAAIMVKGELTAPQLHQLREQFPTVPFINKHNELLDDIGQAERQEVRAKYKRDMELGETAVEEGAAKAAVDVRRAQKMAAFIRGFSSIDMKSVRKQFSAGKNSKGESMQIDASSNSIKIDKTHIPSSGETKPQGLNITHETSADDIAAMAINTLVPQGAVITPEKEVEFSNKVKRELARKHRIHPDVDQRAQEAFAKIDDELNARKKQSRTAA